MIILNWNIKGLGDLDKKAKVRDFLQLFGIDMVALQESKLCSPSFNVLRSIGCSRINEWAVLDSLDASGGQLIGWNGIFFGEN